MPGIALRRFAVMSARFFSSARNTGWCERSPSSASATANCIGYVLHSRPSANFFTAASTASSLGVRVRYLNVGYPNVFGFKTPPHLIAAVEKAMRDGHNGYGPRSEERRVGKEGRSRW